MDEILWCDHSNESYWAVLSCGTVYFAVQGGSKFWVYGWNPMVLPFKWNLFSSTFMWYYLYLSILQNEMWDLSWILILGTLGSKTVKCFDPVVPAVSMQHILAENFTATLCCNTNPTTAHLYNTNYSYWANSWLKILQLLCNAYVLHKIILQLIFFFLNTSCNSKEKMNSLTCLRNNIKIEWTNFRI